MLLTHIHNKLHSEQSGFTLIEVLIATVIFAIGALGVVALLVSTMKARSIGREQVEATIIAEWQMERLQTITPNTDPLVTGCTVASPCYVDDQINTPDGTTVETISMAGIAPSIGSDIEFQVIWSGEDLGGANAGLRHYIVTVWWPRDDNLLGLPTTDPAFVDCIANQSECQRVVFHSFRDI